MAIVFISPKERQKVFILGIVVIFVLFIAVISLIIFLAKPKKMPVELIFEAPKIRINFDVLTSNKIKDLEFLPEIEKEFNYTAKTEKNRPKTGKVAAPSSEEAEEILTALGLSNIALEEIRGGRENPFSPY
jgi:predicted tellurium resistance membrane protein TerC